MSANSDWDVEKHKLEHECDEHWELRRSFLESHKDKFPEDQLVCLAQVFTNVELLGCRYPQETMDQIAELSREVAYDFRERQKNRLQRTFVKASDAASSKVKGTLCSSSQAHPTSIEPSNKKAKTTHCCRRERYRQLLANFVIMQHTNGTPQTNIENSLTAIGAKVEWKCGDIPIHKKVKPPPAGLKVCEIFIKGKFMEFGYAQTKKEAKADAAAKMMEYLATLYYTIQVKEDWKSSHLVKQMTVDKAAEPTEQLFESSNIGVKLMKSMGWQGGGLGKCSQGNFDPVTIEQQIARNGVGMTLNSTNMKQFTAKCNEVLVKFIQKGYMHEHLAFSDMTNEERATMHKCAAKLGLKSESYGKADRRTLFISLKTKPQTLLKQLLALGGQTEKYMLKEPCPNEKFDSITCDTDTCLYLE